MTHTPTPWRRGQEGNQRIYGPDGCGEDSGLICAAVRARDIDHIVKAVNAHDDLVAALKQSMTAIDDWLNLFAEDLCNEDRVAEARARVGAGGHLWYIATVQEINRNALKLAGVK